MPDTGQIPQTIRESLSSASPSSGGIIGHDQASPQQTTSQQATVTLSFKCLTRLSQWRASRAVMAPGEKELVQTKDVFKKNELRLTQSLVEFLTSSSSLYPRVKRQTLSMLPQLCSPNQCSPASNLSFLQHLPKKIRATQINHGSDTVRWQCPVPDHHGVAMPSQPVTKASGKSSGSLAKTTAMNL